MSLDRQLLIWAELNSPMMTPTVDPLWLRSSTTQADWKIALTPPRCSTNKGLHSRCINRPGNCKGPGTIRSLPLWQKLIIVQGSHPNACWSDHLHRPASAPSSWGIHSRHLTCCMENTSHVNTFAVLQANHSFYLFIYALTIPYVV